MNTPNLSDEKGMKIAFEHTMRNFDLNKVLSAQDNGIPDLRNPQTMKSAFESVKRVHSLLKPEIDALCKVQTNQELNSRSKLSQDHEKEIRTFSRRPVSTEIRDCPIFLFGHTGDGRGD